MHIRPRSALKVVLFSAIAGAALPLAKGDAPAKPAEAAKSSEAGKTHTVTNLGVKMTVPEAWKSHETKSNLHLMQFSIPKGEGDKDDTDVSVWYFGLNGAGGVNENLQRWMDEFDPKDRKLKLTTGKCPSGDYTLMDISGTWDRKVPTPQGGLKIVHTNGREIAVAVKGAQGDYFYRLSGPEKTVAANLDAFRAAISADAKNEKDYNGSSKVTVHKPVVEKPAAAPAKPAESKPAAGKTEPKK
jgi:hypothetical protein